MGHKSCVRKFFHKGLEVTMGAGDRQETGREQVVHGSEAYQCGHSWSVTVSKGP